MCEWHVEQLWRFGSLVRRRRTHKSGFIQEMLNWRAYALTWTGSDELRFIGEARDGRWRVVIIVAWVVLFGLLLIILLGGGR